MKLKEQARALEQKDQHREALELYIRLAEEDGAAPDLWKRVGDLRARMNEVNEAVDAYQHAMEGYADQDLRNIAIAIGTKILRLDSERTAVYRRLAELAASQGYLSDARKQYLEFAERTQEEDAALNALRQALELIPEDAEVRRRLASRLRSHGREEEAVTHLRELWMQLHRQGDVEQAEAVQGEILEIAPNVELSPPTAPAVPGGEEDDEARGLELMSPLDGTDGDEETDIEPLPADLDGSLLPTSQVPDLDSLELGGAEPLEGLERTLEGEDLEDAGELPLLGMDSDFPLAENEDVDEEDTAEEALPLLPLMSEGTPPAREALAPLEELRARVAAGRADLNERRQLVKLLLERGRVEEVATLAARLHPAFAAAGRFADAAETAALLAQLHPGDTALLKRWVEYASRSEDRDPLITAFLALGWHLREQGDEAQARSLFERVLELDPAHEEARRALAGSDRAGLAAESEASSDYVDLAALVLDDSPEAVTRFIMEAAEPSGDEDRDFAEMLQVFRKKVADHIDAEDATSHYDLGLAFKEMGLLDDAISQFQVALRAGADPLATLEMLGECFVQKGQCTLALRVLERAAQLRTAAEADLVGVYYWSGRCEETLEHAARAREFYERVVAVDVGFRDAAARLQALRDEPGRPL